MNKWISTNPKLRNKAKTLCGTMSGWPGPKLRPGLYVTLFTTFLVREGGNKLYFYEPNQTRYLAKGLWNVISNTS